MNAITLTIGNRGIGIARAWVTLMKRLGYRRNVYIASEAFHSILFATSSTHTIVQ